MPRRETRQHDTLRHIGPLPPIPSLRRYLHYAYIMMFYDGLQPYRLLATLQRR